MQTVYPEKPQGVPEAGVRSVYIPTHEGRIT